MHQNWRWCMTKNPFVVEALWAVASRQDCREGETSSLQSRRHRRQRVARSAKPDLMLIKILCSCQPTRLQRWQTSSPQSRKHRRQRRFENSRALRLYKQSKLPRHWASIHVDAKLGPQFMKMPKKKPILKFASASPLWGKNPPQAPGCAFAEATTTSSG